MGELKGQLLGVLLVLMLFGAVAATFKGIVDQTNDQISEQYNKVMDNLDETTP
ncbi:MAG: hypothetical protein ACOX28_04240 [Bacilli bacterium]|jgi:Na+-translocating ferredoxin:NAD+ oxidoreductase RnfG subunit